MFCYKHVFCSVCFIFLCLEEDFLDSTDEGSEKDGKSGQNLVTVFC